ncbi:MAG: HAD family phosphatase [Spirochaetaceae bacterium]|nr:MAG: HAD family phosphatase [Spirochaetaceae bacterium]
MAVKAMVVTDLDGTLFQKDHRISRRNYQTLSDLGEQGVLRVIATGRNLFSAHKVLPNEFPIDFLIFSSGAGIMAWPRQQIVYSVSLEEEEVSLAFKTLRRRSLDFMVHRPIPDNHHFVFYSSGQPNPDFEARCALYRDFAAPGRNREVPPGKACQLVAIEPYHRPTSHYAEIRKELDRLTVVRTTSPLDRRSLWIEIFSKEVSKAKASIRIIRDQGIREDAVMAIGNDYNDLDLLRWAARSFVVSDAPGELAASFQSVQSGEESDFSEAVALWQREIVF